MIQNEVSKAFTCYINRNHHHCNVVAECWFGLSGVNWYASYLEEGLLQHLPADAAHAYRDLNAGIVPDTAALKELFRYLNGFSDPLDWNVYISVLVSGLLSALICSAIGIYLARKLRDHLSN